MPVESLRVFVYTKLAGRLDETLELLRSRRLAFAGFGGAARFMDGLRSMSDMIPDE